MLFYFLISQIFVNVQQYYSLEVVNCWCLNKNLGLSLLDLLKVIPLNNFMVLL